MNGSVAAGINRIINERGYVQRTIAMKSGFSEQQFSDMICGRKVIRADYLIPIARAMHVSIQDIYDAGEGQGGVSNGEGQVDGDA